MAVRDCGLTYWVDDADGLAHPFEKKYQNMITPGLAILYGHDNQLGQHETKPKSHGRSWFWRWFDSWRGVTTCR